MSTTDAPSRWFLREPRDDARARLFCIPYSGCGASMYRSWPTSIGDVDVCPVQLPGRENRMREPAHTTYDALADALADALDPLLDRPYGLFGHCGSALAAYETAVRLVRTGRPTPTALFVSSEVAPQDGPYGRFLEMTEEELSRELHDLMRAMGSQASPDMVAMLLEVLNIDVEANRRYHVPDPLRLSCPVFAIGWDADDGVRPELMKGWATCGDPTTFPLLAGGHYAFLDAPDGLLDVLGDGLQDGRRPQAQAPGRGRAG